MINTLALAKEKNILYGMSASTELQNEGFPQPLTTYILKGDFTFYNYPNILYYGEEQIVINRYRKEATVALVDNIQGEQWDKESEPIISNYNKCENLIKLDEEIMCLIATQWSSSNIVHMIFDSIGKIVTVEKFFKLEDIIFLVPNTVAWYKEMLDILGLRCKLYKLNTKYYGNFIVPSMPSHFGQSSFDVNKFYKEKIVNYNNSKTSPYIYISRAKVNKRSIINENELVDYLKTKKPFEVIYMEDYSVAEKINIFKNAKITVAPHGAGLALSFLQESGTLIEIFSPYYINLCFQSIIKNSNSIKYKPFFCGHEANFYVDKELNSENFEINIEKFSEIFNTINI